MSAVKKQSNMQRVNGSMLIRRIVRKAGEYICGLCRTHYNEVEQANTCLKNCWQGIQSRPPIFVVRKMTGSEYACIYCLRSYKALSTAFTCATDCLTELDLTYYEESGSDNSSSKPRWRQGKPKLKLLPKPQESQHVEVKETKVSTAFAEPAVSNPPEAGDFSPPPAELEPESIKKGVGEPPEVAEDAKLASKAIDRTIRFSREGSKYVCSVCSSKYFTKDEVETCFESHPAE